MDKFIIEAIKNAGTERREIPKYLFKNSLYRGDRTQFSLINKGKRMGTPGLIK